MKNMLGLILLLTLVSCASNKAPVKTINEKKAELYYNHGTTKLMAKEYTEALDNLLKAHRFSNEDIKILNNLGMAYFFKKKNLKAKYYFNKAIELDPKNSDSRNNLASIHFTMGEYKQALKQYLIVKNDLIYTSQHRTSYNIGLVYERLGKTEDAISYFTKATELKEDYCAALNKLGVMNRKKYRYSTAIEWLESAQKGACHNEPAPLYNMAVTYIDLQKYGMAQSKFKELQERFASTRYSTLATLQLRKLQTKNIISKKDENLLKEISRKMKKKKKAESINTPTF